MSKYEVFMKGEGCSIRRNFETEDDEFNIKYLFDEECDNENIKIQWIKIDGKKVNIDNFGSHKVGKDGK